MKKSKEKMKSITKVQVLSFVLLSISSFCASAPDLVLIKTSISTSSSSSSSNAAEPMEDSLAVEGRNVKIVRRIRVRTSTTPAPEIKEFGKNSEFKETPEILEWFALKHKEFERVKGESSSSTPRTTTTTTSTSTTTESSVPRANGGSGASSLLSDAEYMYEFSDTSNGPRVQVIYGDGKTRPPAGLMESPDMLSLVREHLQEANGGSNGLQPAQITQQQPEQVTQSPPQATVPSATPPAASAPISPQDILLPPFFDVGGSPISMSPPQSIGTPFFSPFHGSAFTPHTETKTYVSSAPAVFTQPTSVTMPPMHVPGVKAATAWRWPTYIEEQESGNLFKGFYYNFPVYTTSNSGVRDSQPSPLNYYPAELPFSSYEEPAYNNQPVAPAKSRPDASPNSIPWTPLPPSLPFQESSSGDFQNTRSSKLTSSPTTDSQTTADSSRKNLSPGSYSTLGKRMTAPDTREPTTGQYPDDAGHPDETVIRGNTYVSSFSPEPLVASSSDDYSSGSDSNEDEYSNFVMDSGPSYDVHGHGVPSYAPMPQGAYNQYSSHSPMPPLPPKPMFPHFSRSPATFSSSFPPFIPLPQPPPSLPAFYTPGPSPPPKHYKIMFAKPPPGHPPRVVPTRPTTAEDVAKTLVYMLNEAPRAGPVHAHRTRAQRPPTPPPNSQSAASASAPSTPQLYYVTSGSYKKRSA